MQSLLSASLQMILSLIFCDVISSSLFRSPTVAPLVARQPFLKIAYLSKKDKKTRRHTTSRTGRVTMAVM